MHIAFPRAILGALATLALLFCPACRDAQEGGTGTKGTALYVFDASDSVTNRVLVWDNMETLWATPTTPPTRNLSGTLLNKVKTLAWGGMCLDRSANRLLLVSETGDVVRVERVRTQNGAVTATSDIVSFRLGDSDSDHLSGGKFGQASVDPSNGTLYVTESNDSSTRIWVVSNLTSYLEGSAVTPPQIIPVVPGDKDGWSVAAGSSGRVYAYCDNGNSIKPDTNTYTGARLRSGTSSGLSPDTSVIIGIDTNNNKTLLGKYGALAVDTSTNILFVARHNTDSSMTGKQPVLAFNTGLFSPGYNVAPSRTLGATSGMDDLRILSHAGNRDWLVGATCAASAGSGSNRLWIWKAPSTGDTSTSVDLSSTVIIKGLALDGNN